MVAPLTFWTRPPLDISIFTVSSKRLSLLASGEAVFRPTR